MITLILSLLFNPTLASVSAVNENQVYAQVVNENVYFYKSAVDDLSYDNIFFVLPKTYFVLLVDNANEQFYKAQYQNFNGFVKKDEVQAIRGTPSNPYLNNLTFRVFSDLSCKLMSSPSLNSSQLANIPLLTKNIKYIAKVSGDVLIEDRTNQWYYCEFNENQYGYVYSDFCDGLPSVIPQNTEAVTFIPNPTFEIYSTQQSLPADDNKIGIIIAILSIPAVIFVFMLFQGSKILSKERTKRQEIKEY